MTKCKKDTAIVIGGTSNLTFAMGVFLIDLKQHSPNLADEAVIFHDGKIKKSDMEVISQIYPARFIEYDFPIKDLSIFNEGTIQYFSKMVFSKFECLRLLDDYKNVIWLDFDIISIKDIYELREPCKTGIKMSFGLNVQRQLYEPVEEYDMNAPACGAGTFAFYDNLKNYKELYKWCYMATEKYAKKIQFPEQAIFDFMFQEFNLKADEIDPNLYFNHPKDHKKFPHAKLLHCYGGQKFWNGYKCDQWNKNYKIWLKMGGSKKQKIKTQNSKLVSLTKKIFKPLKHHLKNILTR